MEDVQFLAEIPRRGRLNARQPVVMLDRVPSFIPAALNAVRRSPSPIHTARESSELPPSSQGLSDAQRQGSPVPSTSAAAFCSQSRRSSVASPTLHARRRGSIHAVSVSRCTPSKRTTMGKISARVRKAVARIRQIEKERKARIEEMMKHDYQCFVCCQDKKWPWKTNNGCNQTRYDTDPHIMCQDCVVLSVRITGRVPYCPCFHTANNDVLLTASILNDYEPPYFMKKVLSARYVENKRREEKKEYICPICERQYTNKAGLKKHVSNYHGEKIPCKNCGKLYVEESPYNHRCKKKVTQFCCRKCGKAFTTNSNRKRHMLMNCSENPYSVKCMTQKNKKK